VLTKFIDWIFRVYLAALGEDRGGKEERDGRYGRKTPLSSLPPLSPRNNFWLRR